MKTLLLNLFVLVCVSEICAQQINQDKLYDNKVFPSGCSVITVAMGDSVFFGGNDDYINADSYYWVEPGDSAKYGVIWIGKPDNPQQGINEKGLAYDANGLPRFEINPHTERIPVKGEWYHQYIMQILHECSTVEEVITWAGLHQHLPYMHDQLHFADSTGDAVIISAGADGEMVFTRKPPGDGFLVSTNFNVANPSNNSGYPCWRYDKATELLDSFLKMDDTLSFRYVTDVMDAIHTEKGSSWTIETMVADLVSGNVYIYFFFQYDRPVVLNVKKELSNPREPGPLSQLFPEDIQKEAVKRYNAARINLHINRIVGIAWPSVILVSLILLFLNHGLFKTGFRFWVTAVVFLGPATFLAGFFALKKCKTTFCRYTIIETLGNLIPLVISNTVAMVLIVLSSLSGSGSWQVQVAAIFGLPIILGLLFHTLFLASVSNKNFGRFINQCFPTVLVTTFIGLGGIVPVATTLVIMSLYMPLLIPLSLLSVMTWWAFVALGAIPGGLFIFFFQRWVIKKGYRAWSVLTENDGEVLFPKWGKIWWWLLIGVVVLCAGLIIGIVLQKN